MLEVLKAVLMGIVEGITEWLPVSSTGHMILVEQVVQFELSDAFVSMFRVVIQLGAILAVVLLYFGRLWPFRKLPAGEAERGSLPQKLLARCDREKWILWAKILVASLPAAIIGLPLDDWLDEHLYNAPVVGLMLILYGVLFLVVEDRRRRPRIVRMEQLTYRDAVIIGIWQVLALIPGTSRSGATIVGGLMLGTSRPLAAQFTFYLAIPVMFGASGLKLVKFVAEGNSFTGQEVVVLLVGMLVAFLVSVAAIRFLMNYVKRHSFKVFGWYRIFLGALVLSVAFWEKVLG